MASQPTATQTAPDVQASLPATQVSLSRVGVTGVEKVIRVKADGGENLFYAGFECFVALNPRQAGVHISPSEEVERVVDVAPTATHNQRGIGTLHVGCPEGGPAWIDAPELLRIVESSMSSEIYELMKRSDEMSVVVKAHEQPRFVEDCVREMVRQVVEGYPDLPGDAFVMARQENLETIHRHNVIAERYGTLDELRAELASGEHQARHQTMREWLELAGT